jgi:HAD superfamily hydrolase (TIGR01509 family)
MRRSDKAEERAVMHPQALFLDDGGVLNDNALRGPQWHRLMGEFFPPRLGGAASAWAHANRAVITEVESPAAVAVRRDSFLAYADYDRALLADWLSGMIQLVGVDAPPPDLIVPLALEATAVATRRVQSAYPEAVATILALHARGYRLSTASAGPSYVLEGYLTGMGVREYFLRLYGPDLVNAHKDSPDYYPRLFADCGVAPARALVVDDSPAAVARARAAGARALLMDRRAAKCDGETITNLSQLLTLLQP